MAIEEIRRYAKLVADGPDLVLIERAEGFDHAALIDELLNPRDAIVVGLDEIGFGRSAGFDGVRIDGALAQNPAAVEIALGFKNPLLHFDEFFADYMPLLLRLDGVTEGGEELRLGMLHLKMAGAKRGEVCAHEICFSFAHQTGINVSAVDPVLA